MKKLFKIIPLALASMLFAACTCTKEARQCPTAPCKNCPCPMTAKEYPCNTPGAKCVQGCKCPCASTTAAAPAPVAAPIKSDAKQVTNSTAAVPVLTKEMFYDKDGKFNQEAAKQAYIDMMNRLNYPVSDNLRENMWATDFGLGDFPAVGMGGIFWAQEGKYGVFGHEILLLPNQLLVEHWHVPADGLPAKYECWQARAGKSYCFGEEGVDASNFPDVKLPESQKNFITVNKVAVADAKKGNVVWLNRIEARHYQIAGPEGAVVTEYGSFHGNNAQRFTNPEVKF